MTEGTETTTVSTTLPSTPLTAEDADALKTIVQQAVSDVVQGVSKIDFDSLTEEKVLSMTEFEVEEVKEQAKLYTSKADVLNGYLKALAWKAFKAKFTWANFKTLISSAWAKLKSWLSNLDPIFRYAIYALILAKLFNLI